MKASLIKFQICGHPQPCNELGHPEWSAELTAKEMFPHEIWKDFSSHHLSGVEPGSVLLRWEIFRRGTGRPLTSEMDAKESLRSEDFVTFFITKPN